MRWNRYQLGDYLELAVQPTNASLTPTVPDDYPTAKIFDSSGTLIDTVTIPVVYKPSATEYYFERRWRLDSDYSAGTYMLVYQYETGAGANVVAQCQTFDIVAGGNSDGAVIGQYFQDVPEAQQVVYQLDGGRMVSRRFPRL